MIISLKDPKTGMMFYVESDGRRLIALDRDGMPASGLDVFAEAKVTPAVGKPVVRHLRLDGNRLWVTCGKHDIVRIDITNGRVDSAGADSWCFRHALKQNSAGPAEPPFCARGATNGSGTAGPVGCHRATQYAGCTTEHHILS